MVRHETLTLALHVQFVLPKPIKKDTTLTAIILLILKELLRRRYAPLMELVDILDLKSNAARRTDSNSVGSTNLNFKKD